MIDHVAVLVESLEGFLRRLPAGSTVGKVEVFEGSGTKECYVGDPETEGALLLVMEAVGEGPYREAFKKRGPGLHHVAVVTDDLEGYGKEVEKSRMLLHPVSLRSAKRGTLWLCRPGVPFLIEVVEVERGSFVPRDKRFVKSIELAMDEESWGIAGSFLPGLIVRKEEGRTRMVLGEGRERIELG